MESRTVFFKEKKYPNSKIEFGIVHDSDRYHIWFFNEPCKVPIADCIIIPDSDVFFKLGYPYQKLHDNII
jgi:hypothetical protein